MSTKLLLVPLAILAFVAIVQYSMGGSGFPFTGTDLILAIAAVGIAMAVFAFIPLVNGQGAIEGIKVAALIALWGTISVFGGAGAISSIPDVGIVLYFFLTAVYAVGVLQSFGHPAGS